LSTVVDAVYDLFSENYLESSYLAQGAMVWPNNNAPDAMNDYGFFSRVLGLQGNLIVVTLSCGGVSLLYPLKFLYCWTW
jgi:hypothetical protein